MTEEQNELREWFKTSTWELLGKDLDDLLERYDAAKELQAANEERERRRALAETTK